MIIQKMLDYIVNADAFNIIVIGVGGTGSRVALESAKLMHHAREKGVQVSLTLIDPDIVEDKNVGRQQFGPAEVGLNKAVAKARALSLWLGCEVAAIPSLFESGSSLPLIGRGYRGDAPAVMNIVVGCLDDQHGNAGRQAIAAAMPDHQPIIWIDAGNDQYSGQVLVGTSHCKKETVVTDSLGLVSDIPYPHIAQPALLKASETAVSDDVLSCAELTFMDEQSLFINSVMATIVASYLESIVFRKRLSSLATYANLKPFPTVQSEAITAESLADAMSSIPPVES